MKPLVFTKDQITLTCYNHILNKKLHNAEKLFDDMHIIYDEVLLNMNKKKREGNWFFYLIILIDILFAIFALFTKKPNLEMGALDYSIPILLLPFLIQILILSLNYNLLRDELFYPNYDLKKTAFIFPACLITIFSVNVLINTNTSSSDIYETIAYTNLAITTFIILINIYISVFLEEWLFNKRSIKNFEGKYIAYRFLNILIYMDIFLSKDMKGRLTYKKTLIRQINSISRIFSNELMDEYKDLEKEHKYMFREIAEHIKSLSYLVIGGEKNNYQELKKNIRKSFIYSLNSDWSSFNRKNLPVSQSPYKLALKLILSLWPILLMIFSNEIKIRYNISQSLWNIAMIIITGMLFRVTGSALDIWQFYVSFQNKSNENK
jgi:hypothetical protein